MNKNNPLISARWLNDHLNDKDLIIFEANLKNPITKREIKSEIAIIPGAICFDIEKDFSDPQNDLPHTMLAEVPFTEALRKLGVNSNSLIVVYDNVGIYSSPRAWWMLKTMGFENVFVLNGGLPEWQKNGFKVDSNYATPKSKGNFKAQFNPKLIVDSSAVLKAINNQNQVIIDARSAERFAGKVDEPRAGLRKGHMPNAINIPFSTTLLNNKLLAEEQLNMVFEGIGKEKDLIFSCGSGVTACVNALAATVAGYKNISIYDGSWSEWGLVSDLPVVRT